ncbi:hypothetical protein R1flu_005014 [Riccia fluitans]|uniref:Uncharacterized protein n=1 Tax=Riccia fluitans TaxID=41844 RepID=A0ABD1YSR0_9MARC
MGKGKERASNTPTGHRCTTPGQGFPIVLDPITNGTGRAAGLRDPLEKRERGRCLVLSIHLMIDSEVASIVLLPAIHYVFPGMIGFGMEGRSGLGWHPNAPVARIESDCNVFPIS